MGKVFWAFTPVLVNGFFYLILLLGVVKMKQYFPVSENRVPNHRE
jgi:hypothetical protein